MNETYTSLDMERIEYECFSELNVYRRKQLVERLAKQLQSGDYEVYKQAANLLQELGELNE